MENSFRYCTYGDKTLILFKSSWLFPSCSTRRAYWVRFHCGWNVNIDSRSFETEHKAASWQAPICATGTSRGLESACHREQGHGKFPKRITSFYWRFFILYFMFLHVRSIKNRYLTSQVTEDNALKINQILHKGRKF